MHNHRWIVRSKAACLQLLTSGQNLKAEVEAGERVQQNLPCTRRQGKRLFSEF
jgi:hypothetical protein